MAPDNDIKSTNKTAMGKAIFINTSIAIVKINTCCELFQQFPIHPSSTTVLA
jgi:hypothetical protein